MVGILFGQRLVKDVKMHIELCVKCHMCSKLLPSMNLYSILCVCQCEVIKFIGNGPKFLENFPIFLAFFSVFSTFLGNRLARLHTLHHCSKWHRKGKVLSQVRHAKTTKLPPPLSRTGLLSSLA